MSRTVSCSQCDYAATGDTPANFSSMTSESHIYPKPCRTVTFSDVLTTALSPDHSEEEKDKGAALLDLIAEELEREMEPEEEGGAAGPVVKPYVMSAEERQRVDKQSAVRWQSAIDRLAGASGAVVREDTAAMDEKARADAEDTVMVELTSLTVEKPTSPTPPAAEKPAMTEPISPAAEKPMVILAAATLEGILCCAMEGGAEEVFVPVGVSEAHRKTVATLAAQDSKFKVILQQPQTSRVELVRQLLWFIDTDMPEGEERLALHAYAGAWMAVALERNIIKWEPLKMTEREKEVVWAYTNSLPYDFQALLEKPTKEAVCSVMATLVHVRRERHGLQGPPKETYNWRETLSLVDEWCCYWLEELGLEEPTSRQLREFPKGYSVTHKEFYDEFVRLDVQRKRVAATEKNPQGEEDEYRPLVEPAASECIRDTGDYIRQLGGRHVLLLSKPEFKHAGEVEDLYKETLKRTAKIATKETTDEAYGDMLRDVWLLHWCVRWMEQAGWKWAKPEDGESSPAAGEGGASRMSPIHPAKDPVDPLTPLRLPSPSKRKLTSPVEMLTVPSPFSAGSSPLKCKSPRKVERVTREASPSKVTRRLALPKRSHSMAMGGGRSHSMAMSTEEFESEDQLINRALETEAELKGAKSGRTCSFMEGC